MCSILKKWRPACRVPKIRPNLKPLEIPCFGITPTFSRTNLTSVRTLKIFPSSWKLISFCITGKGIKEWSRDPSESSVRTQNAPLNPGSIPPHRFIQRSKHIDRVVNSFLFLICFSWAWYPKLRPQLSCAHITL